LQGKCLAEHHSLHITISSYQLNTWTDLLDKLLPAALAVASQEDIQFREVGTQLDFLKKQVFDEHISRCFLKCPFVLDKFSLRAFCAAVILSQCCGSKSETERILEFWLDPNRNSNTKKVRVRIRIQIQTPGKIKISYEKSQIKLLTRRNFFFFLISKLFSVV
jgi:hypothetical protein